VRNFKNSLGKENSQVKWTGCSLTSASPHHNWTKQAAASASSATGHSTCEWTRTQDKAQPNGSLLKIYGEERQAGRIAHAIVAARGEAPIDRTGQLADIIAAAAPAHGQKRHPATRSFQAIRIFINGELDQLERVLEQSVDVLRKAGRLCVISFHSLEDRIVKRFIRDASRESEQYRGMPVVPEEFRPKLKPVGKLIEATAEEIAANVRARSARLRVAEKT
jgi:16S rRNA (cytosine1402-N4)-methyltransferase